MYNIYIYLCIITYLLVLINIRKSSINISNTSENGQQISRLKTDGYISNRYRLAHWWVAEMLLNVQSVSSIQDNCMHKPGIIILPVPGFNKRTSIIVDGKLNLKKWILRTSWGQIYRLLNVAICWDYFNI